MNYTRDTEKDGLNQYYRYVISIVIIITTYTEGLIVHLDGWFICDELQCGLTSDCNSQSIGIVLQTHTQNIEMSLEEKRMLRFTF